MALRYKRADQLEKGDVIYFGQSHSGSLPMVEHVTIVKGRAFVKLLNRPDPVTALAGQVITLVVEDGD
jgi:hypothetical protein